MPAFVDINGQTFGKWSVLERAENIGKAAAWRCECECGDQRVIRGTALRTGSTKSCQRCASKNTLKLSGKKFGLLTALEPCGRDGQGYILWKCRCDCGRIKKARSSRLKSGATKNCGCQRPERRNPSEYISLDSGESNFRLVYGDYLYSAQRRGLVFELTESHAHRLFSSPCHYCGIPPQAERNNCNGGAFTYNGIDRKDNDKGYTLDNCVPCCADCNYKKSTDSYAHFMAWVDRIAAFRGGDG